MRNFFFTKSLWLACLVLINPALAKPGSLESHIVILQESSTLRVIQQPNSASPSTRQAIEKNGCWSLSGELSHLTAKQVSFIAQYNHGCVLFNKLSFNRESLKKFQQLYPLKKIKKLLIIHPQQNNDTEEGLVYLSKNVFSLIELRLIHLHKNTLSLIQDFLTENTHLKSIELRGFRFSNSQWLQIMRQLYPYKLEKLILRQNHLNDLTAAMLASFIFHKTLLEYFDISENPLTLTAVRLFIKLYTTENVFIPWSFFPMPACQAPAECQLQSQLKQQAFTIMQRDTNNIVFVPSSLP